MILIIYALRASFIKEQLLYALHEFIGPPSLQQEVDIPNIGLRNFF